MSEESKAVFDEAQLKSALKENHDKVEALITKANEEAKSALSISTETKQAIDKLVAEGKSIDERLVALEQRGHNDAGKEYKTLGRQFVESEGYRSMMEGRSRVASLEVKTTLTNATINMVQPLVAPDHIGTPAHLPERDLMVWDVLPKGMTGSNIIAWPRETYTNSAGPQVSGSPLAYTEGATKPESAFSFTQVTRPVQTIAHFLPVSTQLMEDAPAIESYLQNRLVYGLREELEDQVLLGSGANGNLSGLVTEATAYSASASPDPAGTREMDILRSAIRQLQVQNYRPSHIVLNPADWFDIEITKVNVGTDDRYIIGNPASALTPRLWGLPVIVSNAMTSGSYLVGDMNNGAMVFEKSGISFQAAYQDSTNFQKNLVTLRAEARLVLCVWRTEAFVTGSL